jgi:catechol 2,3-dioxygenase-like lactoylglutathione lyase family enzyme
MILTPRFESHPSPEIQGITEGLYERIRIIFNQRKEMIPITRIKETCLYVTNLEKTKAFYHQKLGLPLISMVPGRHIFFQAGESVLLCFIASQTEKETILPPHGATGRIHFAFEVEQQEYEKVVQEIENSGIGITHHHTWPNGVRSFYFSDPDEHVVEILEEGLWEKR